MSCSEHDTKKILLRQPQLFSGFGLVVRIQHFRDGFGCDLLVHGAVVVADVERVEVERLGGFRFPQPQQVRGGHPITRYRGVVGDALDHPLGEPAHAIASVVVEVGFGAPAELHVERDVRAHDFPRVAEAQPLVGELDLPAVANRLIEDAELVADAVADGGNVERRQRVHVTGRQAAEPAVAEARLFFLLQELGQVLPDARKRLLRRVPDAESDQAVAQMRSGQELGRQIRDDFGAVFGAVIASTVAM